MGWFYPQYTVTWNLIGLSRFTLSVETSLILWSNWAPWQLLMTQRHLRKFSDSWRKTSLQIRIRRWDVWLSVNFQGQTWQPSRMLGLSSTYSGTQPNRRPSTTETTLIGALFTYHAVPTQGAKLLIRKIITSKKIPPVHICGVSQWDPIAVCRLRSSPFEGHHMTMAERVTGEPSNVEIFWKGVQPRSEGEKRGKLVNRVFFVGKSWVLTL